MGNGLFLMTENKNPYQAPQHYGRAGPRDFRELRSRVNLPTGTPMEDEYHNFVKNYPLAKAYQQDFLGFLEEHFLGSRTKQIPGLSVEQARVSATLWKCLTRPLDSVTRFGRGDAIAAPSITFDYGT